MPQQRASVQERLRRAWRGCEGAWGRSRSSRGTHRPRRRRGRGRPPPRGSRRPPGAGAAAGHDDPAAGQDEPALEHRLRSPAPTTPGSVQPGNGSWRSWEPVARSTARARTVAAASSGPATACSLQPVSSGSSVQTWCPGRWTIRPARTRPSRAAARRVNSRQSWWSAPGRRAQLGRGVPVVLAAGPVAGVDEDHPEAAPGRLHGGGEAGGAGADDGEVGAVRLLSLLGGAGRFKPRGRHGPFPPVS